MSAPNQANAYNLMKIILSKDIQANRSLYVDTPVLKSAVRTVSENAMYHSYERLGLPYMAEKELNEYIDILLSPDSCKLMPYTPYYEIFLNDMAPYFEGKKSFEECAAILKNNLELYLSE